MEKKKFSQPEIEVVKFESTDVITTSVCSTTNIFSDIFNLREDISKL
ncbi:MAG: hypothetical protein ACI4MQ_00345 [Candidatus Coproplasma sp.]